jgi:beta-lactamase regulating signal transducer with metallopeptidase domain/multidrug efflux pump subunit AcrA (membrane-fusion protein)
MLLHVGLCNALLATLLALAVVALRPWCRRPALLHSLWLLVLLKLVTPSFLTIPLPGPALDKPDPAPARAIFLPPVMEQPPAVPADDLLAPIPPATSAGPVTEPEAQGPPASPVLRLSWKEALVAVWLIGAVLWWAMAAWRIRRFRRLLRFAQRGPADLQAQARRVADRLGLARCPEVLLVRAPLSPLLWALGWAPRLLLPAALWQRLTHEQRDTLLAHELAHLRRRDPWVRRLELLVLGLYWWHPVAWWARRELREAEEQCCDAWVVWALPAAAPAYAAALVETVAYLSRARTALPMAASGVGHAMILKRRVTMILRDTPPRSLSGAGCLAVLAAAVLLLPLLPSWVQPAPAEEAAAPPADQKAKAETPRNAVPPGHGVGVADFDQDGWPDLLVTGDAKEKARQPAAPADRAAEIEKAKDDIELLKVQIEVKQAQVQAARETLEVLKRRLARFARLVANRAVSQEEYDQAKGEVAVQEAQVRVKEAELREPVIRLQQAQRRLDSLQRRAAAPLPHQGTTAAEALHFGQYVHDFGPVVRGTIVSHRFLVENKSDAVVSIDAVRTSGGALQVELKHSTLKPGEKTFLTLTLDTRRFVGSRAFNIYVRWSGPQSGEAKLQVRADSQEKATGQAILKDDKGVTDPTKVQELQKRIDALQKEIDGLRKQLPRQSSTNGLPNGIILNERNFDLPLRPGPEKAKGNPQ